MQHIANDWWRLWLLHFTPNLQCRNKWFKRRENLSVGDIVLIIDNSIARSQWEYGDSGKYISRKRWFGSKCQNKVKDWDLRPTITKLCLLISKEEWNKLSVVSIKSNFRVKFCEGLTNFDV